MTELEKAKITIEINRLEKEADELESKARNDESMFADAWRQYGSELAGPPQSIEINRNKAKELRRKAEFLKYVDDALNSFGSVTDLDRKISEINLQIETLNKEKVLLYQRMALHKYLHSIIS